MANLPAAIELIPQIEGSPLTGTFSYGIFRADSLVELRITLQISNNSLQFVREADKRYVAHYKIVGVAYKKNELFTTAEYEDSIIVSDFSSTNSAEPKKAGQISILLPKGKFKIVVILEDLNASTKASASFKVKIPDPAKIRISTPWFFTPHDSVLLTNKIPVLWDSIGVAAFVYDIPEGCTAYVSVVGIRAKAKTYPAHFRSDSNGTIVYAFFPISSMDGGEYDATIYLRNKRGGIISKVKVAFTIVPTSFSMLRYHFKELIRQLRLIAKESEIDDFENADSSARDSIWDAFWRQRDPTPSTEYNEYKEEFLKRIRYADIHFGTPYKHGWETDRGKVYILYGKPDEIERHPFELGSPAYEIWYYYSQGVAFVFVDEDGDGDYKLKETR